MRVCILNSRTKECVKVILLDNLEDYIEEQGFELCSDHEGQVGWKFIDNEWEKPNTELTSELLELAVRRKRNLLLKKTVDTVNPIRWSAMSEQQKNDWTSYRQALLDIPQQATFPNNVIWPSKPE